MHLDAIYVILGNGKPGTLKPLNPFPGFDSSQPLAVLGLDTVGRVRPGEILRLVSQNRKQGES